MKNKQASAYLLFQVVGLIFALTGLMKLIEDDLTFGFMNLAIGLLFVVIGMNMGDADGKKK